MVLTLTNQAVEKARNGGGPTLLEFKSWRQLGHTLGDKELYRTAKEKEDWLKKDPIPRFAAVLLENNTAGQEDLAQIEQKIIAEIDEAVQFSIDSPLPELSTLVAGVYAE